MSNEEKKKTHVKMAIQDLHIVLLIDESGSMASIRSDIRGSINKFIRDQQSLADDQSTLSLAKFSDGVDYIYEKKALQQVKELAEEDYTPGGGTALNDAVGLTIAKYGDDKHVCMVIVTDGEENASKTFRQSDIKELISKKQAAGWKFIYLSADITTARQGDRLSMQSYGVNAVNVSSNNLAVGVNKLASNLERACSDAVSAYRSKGLMRGMGSGNP
jgi:uncharacterized protein with von Willebrand factor type A (vWA) domain